MTKSSRFITLLLISIALWNCISSGNPLAGIDIPEPQNADPIYYFFRGARVVRFKDKDNLEQARKDFERVIQTDQNIQYPEAYPFLVECYQQLGIVDSASWVYPEAIHRIARNEKLKSKLSARFESWQAVYPAFPQEFQEKDYKLLDSPPEPVGGFQALYQNLEYPEMARSMNRSGTSYFSIMIEANGSLSDVQLLLSSYPDLDEAALAAIHKSMWMPAKYDGRPVPFQLVYPIMFRL